MKKFLVVIAFFMTIFVCSGCSFGGKVDYSLDMTPRLISSENAMNAETVVKAVSPATVAIRATSLKQEAIGSGVAVASGGYILTNNHVIDGAKTIIVYLANGATSSGAVVWKDSDLDLAVIKASVDMPYVEMSASANLQKGQDVIAIGTPLSLQFEQSVTKGIVSALNRTIEVQESYGVNYMQNLIQHDASINPGNSGGPLFNMRGQVVGINTLKATEAEGMGFAIPIEICVPILNKLGQNLTFQTPYLGIFGFDATTAKYYDKTTLGDGVYVMNVDKDGPCGKAGIKVGDVITGIAGKDVSTLLDLRVSLYEYQKDDVVEIEIERNDERQAVLVTIE